MDVSNAVLPDMRQFGFMTGLEIIHPDNANQAQPSVPGKVLEINPGFYLWSANDQYLGKYTTGTRTKQLVDAAILPPGYPVTDNPRPIKAILDSSTSIRPIGALLLPLLARR